MYNTTFAFYGAVLGIVVFTLGPSLYRDHKQNHQEELLDKAAERLAMVPAHFGPWLLREEETLGETALQILVQPRYISRTYVHNDTGEAVSVVVLAGLTGPTSVHTPEVCMPSREYESVKAPERTEITAKGKKHAFVASQFQARTLDGQKLNVYHGWSRDGDQWEAPEYPRVAFAPLPMLYKVQVVCAVPAVPTEGPTAGEAFLADLVPLLKAQGVTAASVN